MKIVILGSGNVATQLGVALKTSGNEILQVWSRNQGNAEALALKLSAGSLSNLTFLSPDADVYFIAVKDDAIPAVASGFNLKDKLLVHTSGTTGIEVLKNASTRTGVFYPLQTFSKNKAVDFSAVPIAVEGSSPEVSEILTRVGEQISGKVIIMDSRQRKASHVAAVFACNFSNHLYTLSKEILEGNGLDFDLIRPLIAETAGKIKEMEPEEAQTGPARREDSLTINRHLEFLQDNDRLKQLYRLFSESIIWKHRAE
jgi:predicted short-subunit dehydrogenase-like oxidoreductase (DUF2520 family)